MECDELVEYKDGGLWNIQIEDMPKLHALSGSTLFPTNPFYKEPPEHYIDTPGPRLQSNYQVVRSYPSLSYYIEPPPNNRESTLQHNTTTISSGSIHNSIGKLNQPRKPLALQFTGSPFSKIPKQKQPKSSPSKLSLSKSTSYIPPNERKIDPPFNFPPMNNDPKNIQFTVTVSKRSNGNQPWEPSNVRPPMLGKMRRMTVQFAPYDNGHFEVLFQCKDLKPGLHEGKLIVSANDKGIARNSTSSLTEDETIFRTVLHPSSNIQGITVYLKPCWRGFGTNHERPVFLVTIALRPAERDCAFVILHSWKVELHSHKMESSNKGKAMDANGPFEIRNFVPLSVLQHPSSVDTNEMGGSC